MTGRAIAIAAMLLASPAAAGSCVVTSQPPTISGGAVAIVEMLFGSTSCDVPVAMPAGTASPFVTVDDIGVAQASLSADGISLMMPGLQGTTVVRIVATLSPGADPVGVWEAIVTKDVVAARFWKHHHRRHHPASAP